jgi:chromosome partitioning protein
LIVIAIYNMKGGVGKTTTAVNLAYFAAKSGTRTLLWDLDPQAASSFAFRVHPEVEGFGKRSLQKVATLTEAIKATDHDNLDILPADFAYRKLDHFLQQLGRPDRDLAELLEKLGRGYSYVLLDCPPGLSVLSENVFAAADLILVPTIPTVLSLRTLSRLADYIGHRGNGRKVAAFLSMVDKRKGLHRDICEWSVQYPEFFLPAQLPYASVIEQMSVNRMPLAVVAPQDAATAAFSNLWCNVQARLAEPVPPAASEEQRSAAFAKDILDQIAKLGGEADHTTVPDDVRAHELPPDATSSESAADVQDTHRVRLEVHSEDAFESLQLALSAEALQGRTRLMHFFDTDDGVLLRDGYVLQLQEEAGAFAVALETQRSCCGPVSQAEAAQVAAIDGRWAADILAGSRSPITVLERRFGQAVPDLISAAATATGKQPLRRVTWRKRLRRHLGPVLLPHDNANVTLHFELDQISGPGGQVDYEIEATANGSGALYCEDAVRHLFSQAGIHWQPLADRESPVPVEAGNGHHA